AQVRVISGFLSMETTGKSHNRRGEGGRGCAISHTCFSRFAREVLALCSRGTRGIPFWCLQPLCPSIGPVFLSGCFGGFWERVFLLFFGRGCFCFSPRGCFC